MSDSSPNRSALPTVTRCCACGAFCPAFDANGLYVHNCGEQPLPPYGACLLGSINLAAVVKDPFTPQASLDRTALERLVPLAVRMLDNVVDVSRFPLALQEKEA